MAFKVMELIDGSRIDNFSAFTLFRPPLREGALLIFAPHTEIAWSIHKKEWVVILWKLIIENVENFFLQFFQVLVDVSFLFGEHMAGLIALESSWLVIDDVMLVG